jgi:hypothetical protein
MDTKAKAGHRLWVMSVIKQSINGCIVIDVGVEILPTVCRSRV